MKNLRQSTLLWGLTGLLVACGSQTTPGTGTQGAGGGASLPEVSVRLTADNSQITPGTYLAPNEALTIVSSALNGAITKVRYVIDQGQAGEVVREVSGSNVKGKLDVTLPNLTSGSHSVTLTVTDSQGQTGTGSVTFLVDGVAPVLGAITLNGKAVTEGQVVALLTTDAAQFQASATDRRGGSDASLGHTTLRLLAGSAVVAAGLDSLSVDLKPLLATAGTVPLRLEVNDAVGNPGFPRTFSLQVTAPAAAPGGSGTTTPVSEPVLTLLTPSGDFVSGGGTLTLRSSAIKGGTDLSSSVTYSATCGSISGAVWTLGSDCPNGQDQTITATLVDNGKTYSVTRKVKVDASDPTIQITSPQQGQRFTANPVTIAVVATDAVSGVDRVEVMANGVMVGSVTGASGNVTWAPQNGTYTLTAVAYDKVGRSATSSLGGVTVQLSSTDSAAPSVSALTLPSGPQHGTVTLSATVTDAAPSSGVAKVELFEGSTSLGAQTSGVGGVYTFSLDTTKLTDGAHTLRAVVTDNVGLSGERTGTLTTDNTAPSLTWQSPRDGAVTGRTVTLSATSTEGTPSYTVDGQPAIDTDPATPGLQVTLSDGSHTLGAAASDAAGNVGSARIAVNSDGTAPTVTLSAPASGSTVTSNPVTVTASASDSGSGIDRIDLRANGVLIGSVAGASGSVTWAPQNGSYTLTAAAYDRAGNVSQLASSSITVALTTTDASAPVFAAAPALSPAPLAGLSRRTVTVEGVVSDPESGISRVALYDGGTLLPVQASLSPSGSGTRYAFTLDTVALGDGAHALRVVAANGVGLASETSLAARVDNTAPTLNWLSPAGTSVNGASTSLTLAAVAADSSGVSGVTYSASCGTVSGAVWDYSSCADGATAILTATVTDAAGNTTSATKTISVDLSKPTVQITSPQQGQSFTSNPITVTVAATDNVGVSRTEVRANGVLIGTVTGPAGTLTWAPGSGTYTLEATAYDAAGNAGTTSVSGVRVALTTTDTTAPTGELSGAAAGTDVRGTLALTLTARDNVGGSGLASAQLYDGGVLLSTLTSGIPGSVAGDVLYGFQVDTSKLSDGSHTITAVVTDNAGNRSTAATLALKVNNLAPTVSLLRPRDGAVIGAAGDRTLLATASDATPGDAATLTYTVDGSAATEIPATDGQHTVVATARDQAGNTASTSATVLYDGTAPTPSFSGLAPGTVVTKLPLNVTLSATDNLSGVDRIVLSAQLAGGAPEQIGVISGASGALSWAPADGSYTLSAVAYDRAGNVTAVPVTRSAIQVSTGGRMTVGTPDVTAAYTAGSSPLFVRGLGTVSGTATPRPNTSVTAVQLLLDAQLSGAPTVSSGSATFNFDFSTLNEGLHDLGLRWQDSEGSVIDSVKRSVYVDKTGPSLSWNRPVSGETVRQLVTLDTQAGDAGSGLSGPVQYYLDNSPTPLTDADLGTAGFQWDSTTVSFGTHTLTAVVTDAVNNVSQTNITVNTVSSPTISITGADKLVDGSADGTDDNVLSGYVSVNVKADDPTGITRVELYANNNKVSTLTSQPYNFTLNTALYSNGPITIYAKALNNSGESSQTDPPISLNVRNVVAPSLAISAPADNAVITEPSQIVQLNITKRNSSFTLDDRSAKVEILDYRGNLVASQKIPVNENLNGIYFTEPFDLAGLPIDRYTLRATMQAKLDGSGTLTPIETTIQFTTKNTSVNPPASSILMPVALPPITPGAERRRAILNGASGFVVNVSDNTGVDYVQVRLIGTDVNGNPLNVYLLNQGLGLKPRLANLYLPTLDIDGSAYVPDGNYVLRVTVADIEGNRNIQETPVTVIRSVKSTENFVTSVSTTPDSTPKKPNPSSATWTLNGLKPSSDYRVVTLLTLDGEIYGSPDIMTSSDSASSLSLSTVFPAAGAWRVTWILEDKASGLVRSVSGPIVPVIINPDPNAP